MDGFGSTSRHSLALAATHVRGGGLSGDIAGSYERERVARPGVVAHRGTGAPDNVAPSRASLRSL